MSAHISLNLLKELRKKRQNARLAEQLIYFCDKVDKFNNSGVINIRFYLPRDIKIT